jgi:hypothetical protein
MKREIGTTSKEACIIRPCNCKSDFQDRTYGTQNRVWNHAPSKGSKPKRYRCVVCNVEKEF